MARPTEKKYVPNARTPEPPEFTGPTPTPWRGGPHALRAQKSATVPARHQCVFESPFSWNQGVNEAMHHCFLRGQAPISYATRRLLDRPFLFPRALKMTHQVSVPLGSPKMSPNGSKNEPKMYSKMIISANMGDINFCCYLLYFSHITRP